MALPVENYIRLVDDTSSTGRKVRTLQRVVGANTVQEHELTLKRNRQVRGVYLLNTGILTIVVTAQNGTTTGFFWFTNPLSSIFDIRLRRAEFVHQFYDDLDGATCPRVGLRKFTFAGVPTGASIASCKADSAYPRAMGSLVTAYTGLTVNLDNFLFCSFPAVTAYATPAWTFMSPRISEFEPEEEGMIVLQPGEGIVCYQPDAGTATCRYFTVNMSWEELVRE